MCGADHNCLGTRGRQGTDIDAAAVDRDWYCRHPGPVGGLDGAVVAGVLEADVTDPAGSERRQGQAEALGKSAAHQHLARVHVGCADSAE